MLKTVTVRELMDLLADQDPDARVVVTADYGDRGHTQQALPLRGRVEEGLLTESAYSNSGYALASDDEDYADGDEVLVRAKHGNQFYALKRNGYRELVCALDNDQQPIDSTLVGAGVIYADSVRAETWRDAWLAAARKWEWLEDLG